MKTLLFLLHFFTSLSVTADETRTSGVNKSESRSISLGLANDYPPKTASFSRSFREATSFASEDWVTKSPAQQGLHIYFKYQALLSAHELPYSPALLTCKAYRESLVSCGVWSSKQKRRVLRRSCQERGWPITKKFMHPQKITAVRSSTAAGLGQVTRSTAIDTFSRDDWFRSRVPGFENIRDGLTFYNQMAGNMVAQMEFGLAVLHQKRRDGNFRTDKSTLAAYYGSGSRACNNDYADRVLKCEACLESSGVTTQCLDRALGQRSGC